MLAFVLLLFVFSPIATADERLIREQCHNAEVPAACVQCVTSIPGGLQADKFGIAAILLNCMKNHTTNLGTQMAELASSSQDERTKFLATNCTKAYALSGKDLNEAARELKGGDYDKTNSLILDAMNDQITCSDEWATYNLTFPAVYETTVYVELTNAIMRIIDRF